MGGENQWKSNVEFFLTLIGYTIGVGNIWRFPYLCMRNGGGAFLIPYLASLLLCAMPLYVLEVCAGQFSGFGAIKVWNICPLFKGVGIGTFILISVCGVYYNMIICWVIYYLIKSCAKILPWSTCDNNWNSPACWIHQNTENLINQTSALNGTSPQTLRLSEDYGSNLTTSNVSVDPVNLLGVNMTWKSPADEFWHNKALELSPGITDLGGLKWDMVGCLTLAWLLVFLCLCKGTKSLGRVVYVTAPLPYVLLAILLVRGVLLPGSLEGIKYYIIPDWSKLLEFKVWTEASLQIFYSIGPAWGSLFTMASYNQFHSSCIRDAVSVSLIGAGTSFFAGFVIFSVTGFMAFKSGLSIDEVTASGPGLTFIAYPEAIARMPLSPLWAILFFTMLIIVGINSQMFIVETTVNCCHDFFPQFFKNKKVLLVALISLVLLLVGLTMCTRGGIYVFLLIDWYVGAFTVLMIGLLESTVIFYAYGHERFYSDIELMLGHKPLVWWKICWGYICPVMLLVMSVYNVCALGEPYYRNHTFPGWVTGLGWMLAISSFVPIPVGMVKCLLEQKGPLLQRIRSGMQPSQSWGPSDPEVRSSYRFDSKENIPICACSLPFCHQTNREMDQKEAISLAK